MIDRRQFVKGISAACVASSGLAVLRSAHAAEFSYRIAHTTPATHPLHIRLTEAAERIKTDTKGRFELQVFPADQLGSQSDVLGQVRSGAVDFFMLSGVILSTFVPNSAISGVGFAFKDYDTVWKAMDGGLGAFIRGEIAKSKSIFAFEKIWDNGFRQITSSSRPVKAPADLQGLKIRVPPSAMWTSLFKGLGAAPTTINANELYSSLQTKIVDAQENPLAVVSTFKLYEVQKYVSMTNHMWDGFWLLGNRAAFDALPKDIQEIVSKHLNAGALAEREDLVKLNTSLRDELGKKGLQFVTPKPEEFRDKLRTAGFYKEWQGKFPAAGWSQLEAAVGTL
ncbi:TRAP transporter substrate-binding protein [Variovorax sp. J31P207]|uniref:TRAP transporter substrate-binding protein n=1 Tax=Variovorax sp. J31P207 TaxID=3053510 RepID=UPI0025777382|nr:TRAP transporter substrate-binding protein [Variovorax sp. J31P207]MDM0065264.1 TRAP transporter substrate-binding protein [Variovorax sp. J31P207]